MGREVDGLPPFGEMIWHTIEVGLVGIDYYGRQTCQGKTAVWMNHDEQQNPTNPNVAPKSC